MSPAGRIVGAKLMTLAASSAWVSARLGRRLGVAWPLLEGVDTARGSDEVKVPREPSGKDSVWMSIGVMAVVAGACSGLESGETAVDGRGGNGGRRSSSGGGGVSGAIVV